MVMRNRHDGENASEWWDDLPHNIKKRCANTAKSLFNRTTRGDNVSDFSTAISTRTAGVTRDLSWLALIFAVIALINIVFLLIALAFLNGFGLFGF